MRVCVWVHVCIYIYIYVYMYVNTYTYIQLCAVCTHILSTVITCYHEETSTATQVDRIHGHASDASTAIIFESISPTTSVP